MLAPNRESFVSKEIFILRESITANLEMIVAQTSIVRQPFVLSAKTKITVVNASPLAQVYTFTVDMFAPVMSTTEGKPLLFSIEKEVLDKQKHQP